MAAPLLAVEGLTVDIPVAGGVLHAVRGIDFAVGRGETLCLVGESGCGKSLSALAVMDLLPPRARRRATRLEFAGENLLKLPERRMNALRGDRLAMIFQEPMTALNPAYTIGNQLAEVLVRHRGASRRAAEERAVHLLERVGIAAAGERLGQYPHQLSGGLRQRVMIAMALMCAPALLVADEPTTALDVTIQAQILRLLKDLQREFELGLLLITHDLGVVARVADRVAVMYAGEIVETGTAAEIFHRPLHPYTEGLLACLPVPGRTRPGARLGAIPGVVPSLVGELGGCAFRDRCPHAFAACARLAPPAATVGEGRAYRCHLPADRIPLPLAGAR
jgi:peptide/nickel transport system ATP-binding protein